MEHTPTPWTVFNPDNDQHIGDYLEIYHESILIADVLRPGPVDAKANAAFIVKAVNSHEELLESLQSIVDRLEGAEEMERVLSAKWDAIDEAKTAIAKAS